MLALEKLEEPRLGVLTQEEIHPIVTALWHVDVMRHEAIFGARYLTLVEKVQGIEI